MDKKNHTSPVLETLLTKNDLLQALRISSRTLGRLIESGEIPQPIRVGQRPRWRTGDIDKFLGGVAVKD